VSAVMSRRANVKCVQFSAVRSVLSSQGLSFFQLVKKTGEVNLTSRKS
jgi:hypothetical protein